MKKLRHYFGSWEMTTKQILLFAVAAAVYTAAVAVIPFLRDTSFYDINVYLEPWILFATLIAVNSRSWREAGLRCFLFFLISQPLIYLFQVPFSREGFGLFRYYPYWFYITLLTLPGGAIAYLVKRKNWLSVAVLSVATCVLATSAVRYATTAILRFPHHLLSAIFSFASGILLIFVLLDEKKHRAVALALMLTAFLAYGIYTGIDIGKGRTEEFMLDAGTWTYTVEDESVAAVTVDEENRVTVTAGKEGNTFIYFEDADGTVRTVYASVLGGKIFLNEFED